MKPRSPISTDNSETILIDLIIEILWRLPVKSIARCRCVSKLWASTLASPYFTELFMTRSCARPKLLFSFRNHCELVFFSSPQIRDQDENSSLVTANLYMKFPIDDFSDISRPIHGLVCVTHLNILTNERVTVICNPSTGQSLLLPKVVTVNSLLGFDPIDKQFKVLSTTKVIYREDNSYLKHQVLTVGTGNLSWRMIECSISHHYYPSKDGICTNGVLYYVSQLGGPPKVCAIVCFDVRSENFSVINRAEDMILRMVSTLVNYMGKLGVLSNGGFEGLTRESRSLEFWVLVDAEKHEWSKHKYVLPSSWKNVVAEAKIFIVGVTSANEIVLSPRYLSNPFYVFYYNNERNTIRRVEIHGMDAFKNCGVHISLDHVEEVKLL
ncbi:hypothetical protein EUTSA_v10019545mg [Eutrema salsugineum]|uniref:F-box domain-containing protein n=1 Tax=Eutrema salsugineum TaxID=72664 RepID=V4KCE6_EUTSA|nr:F-box protein DOR [Eutrema salsugineum]ESQ28784.1 hypothetical protein EUTSA_v10019545mg [Eutrema salsugineum]